MAAYCRVHNSRHLQADCQELGSAPEPYARASMGRGYLTFFNAVALMGLSAPGGGEAEVVKCIRPSTFSRRGTKTKCGDMRWSNCLDSYLATKTAQL